MIRQNSYFDNIPVHHLVNILNIKSNVKYNHTYVPGPHYILKRIGSYKFTNKELYILENFYIDKITMGKEGICYVYNYTNLYPNALIKKHSFELKHEIPKDKMDAHMKIIEITEKYFKEKKYCDYCDNYKYRYNKCTEEMSIADEQMKKYLYEPELRNLDYKCIHMMDDDEFEQHIKNLQDKTAKNIQQYHKSKNCDSFVYYFVNVKKNLHGVLNGCYYLTTHTNMVCIKEKAPFKMVESINKSEIV